MRPPVPLALILLLVAGAAAFGQAQLPDAAQPGEPLTVWMTGGGEMIVTVANADGTVAGPTPSFRFSPSPGIVLSYAILGLSSTVEPGNYVIDVRSPEGDLISRGPLRILGREFRAEEVELSVTLTELREGDDPRKTSEALELQAIVAEFNADAIYHSGPFAWPIPLTRRTSLYGDRRTYLYADGATAPWIHLGIDLAASTGTPVVASGRGRVKFARSRIVTGKSVVIEHLPGVFSFYYHLDEISVDEGEIVALGQQLGTSGATGLATGPHLHWEFRIGGVSVDPEILLNQPLVDFAP